MIKNKILGVYISNKHTGVPENYRGIGIRIEDDIWLSESGPVVLTKNCPKEVEEIENIVGKRSLH